MYLRHYTSHWLHYLFIALAIIFILCAVIVRAAADETKELGFQNAIDEIAKARAEITSYDVTITGVVENSEREVLTTSGEVFVIEKTPIGFTLEMALDKENKSFLVARKDESLVLKTKEKVIEDWVVYATSPGWELAKYERLDNAFVTDPGLSRVDRPDHFDPLGLGLMFPHEYRYGASIEKLIENYRGWGDDYQTKVLVDGTIRYSNHHDYFMILDRKRGFWPLEMQTNAGTKDVCMHMKLVVNKIHDHWLPESAVVMQRNEKAELKLEWHSVNKPLPKERFFLQEIGRRYGFVIEEQRRNQVR